MIVQHQNVQISKGHRIEPDASARLVSECTLTLITPSLSALRVMPARIIQSPMTAQTACHVLQVSILWIALLHALNALWEHFLHMRDCLHAHRVWRARFQEQKQVQVCAKTVITMIGHLRNRAFAPSVHRTTLVSGNHACVPWTSYQKIYNRVADALCMLTGKILHVEVKALCHAQHVRSWGVNNFQPIRS